MPSGMSMGNHLMVGGKDPVSVLIYNYSHRVSEVGSVLSMPMRTLGMMAEEIVTAKEEEMGNIIQSLCSNVIWP